MSNDTEATTGDELLPKQLTAQEHYSKGMNSLRLAGTRDNDGMRANCLLEAIAHAFLGGLSSELDYRAEVAARELAESEKHQYGDAVVGEDGARFEEDDDRP